MNITVSYHQTNRKTDTEKTLKLWPVFVDHFSQAVPQTLKEYEHTLLKRSTKQGIQTNLILSEECEADWLPKCYAV